MTSRLDRFAALLCALSMAIGVGPLWLAPNDVHDGLMGTFGVASRNFSGIELWLLESNWWLMYLYYKGIAALDWAGLIPYPLSYKLWMTVFTGLLAREGFLYCERVLKMPKWSAWYCASLLMVFPVWSMLFASVQMVVCFVFLVFWGHRRLHQNLGWQQLLGWLAIFLSFQLNSNFAFVLGLEFVRWWLYRCASTSQQVNWRYGRSLALLALAVGAYCFSRFVWPPRGEYAGYNNLLSLTESTGWARLLVSEAKFLTWLALPLLAWAMACVAAKRTPSLREPIGTFNVATIFCLSAVLFVCATMPYAMVGKGTALFFVAWPETSSTFARLRMALGDTGLMSPWGIWSNRFVLHLPLPLAVLGAGAAVWYFSVASPSASSDVTKRVVVLLVPWSLSAVMLLHAHGTKLDQMAFSESIVNGLKTIPAPLGGRLDILVTPAQRFIYPEAHDPNWLAYRAWGKSRWLTVLYYDDGASEPIVRNLAAPQYVFRANDPPRGSVFGATEFRGEPCTTFIQLRAASVDRWDMLMGLGYRPHTAPAAQVQKVSSDCKM